MVDEYQDTNRVQYEFIKLLAGERKNLCVVGGTMTSLSTDGGAPTSAESSILRKISRER